MLSDNFISSTHFTTFTLFLDTEAWRWVLIYFFHDWFRFKNTYGPMWITAPRSKLWYSWTWGCSTPQAGYNRFWKRETSRAGKCLLSLGVVGGEGRTETKIVWRKRGKMLCYDTTTEKEKTIVKKLTWMSGTCVFVPLLFDSKRKTVFLEVGGSVLCCSLVFLTEEMLAFYFKLPFFLKFLLFFNLLTL